MIAACRLAGPLARLAERRAVSSWGRRRAVSKAELEAGHGRNKKAIQFKLRVFPRGHTPTNYTRWFQATQPYQVGTPRRCAAA